SAEEMTSGELNHHDATFPLVVTVRAVRRARAARTEPARHVVNASRSFAGAIVSYHRVADLRPDSHALCTPPDVFRAHMAHLREHYVPIGVDELLSAAASGTIPERAVAVTLDDGYLDALTTASPILMESGIPATFFVNSDRLCEP